MAADGLMVALVQGERGDTCVCERAHRLLAGASGEQALEMVTPFPPVAPPQPVDPERRRDPETHLGLAALGSPGEGRTKIVPLGVETFDPPQLLPLEQCGFCLLDKRQVEDCVTPAYASASPRAPSCSRA
jgi:hypothetical protein